MSCCEYRVLLSCSVRPPALPRADTREGYILKVISVLIAIIRLGERVVLKLTLAAMFERRAKYGLVVHMSRHPKLNEYIANVCVTTRMSVFMNRNRADGAPVQVIVSCRDLLEQVTRLRAWHGYF